MTFKIKDVKEGSHWIAKSGKGEIEIRNVYSSLDCLQYFYLDNPKRFFDSSFIGLIEYFEPKTLEKDLVSEGSFQIKPTGKKVSDLLNGDTVVVIHTTGWREGAETTTVRYELADFMDDEPPFMEILFVDKYDNVVYFTEDMNEPVYDIEGLHVVKGVVN